MRLRYRASPYLRDYLREHGDLHEVETFIEDEYALSLISLIKEGLAKPSPSEKVQILLDEFLEPLMKVNENEKFHKVVSRLYSSEPGNDAMDKFINAAKKATQLREKTKEDLETQIGIVEQAKLKVKKVDLRKLYEAQHQRAKAEVYHEAIKMHIVYLGEGGVDVLEDRNR